MKSLLTYFLLTLFTSLSFAQEDVASDFYFVLPESSFQSLFEQSYAGNYSNQIKNIHLAKPYSTWVEGIRLDMKYKYSIEIGSTTGKYNFQADLSGLRIGIDKIVTDDVINPEVSGAYITIPIHGECHGLSIRRVGQALNVKGNFSLENVGGKLFIKVGDLEVDPNLSWTFAMGKCQGPKGYDEILKGEIEKLMNDSSYISFLLQTELQNKANDIASDLTASILKSHQLPIQDKGLLELIGEEIIFSQESGQLKVKGSVLSHFYSNMNKQPSYLPFELSNEELSSFKKGGFILSQEFLKTLVQQFHKQDIFNKTFNSQEIEGFRELQKNRFFQFFLFPDLMKFNKDANFKLEATLFKNPEVSILGGQEGYIWYQANLSAEVNMLAPKDSSYVPYINFSSLIKARGWVSVNNKQLSIGTYEPEMSLSYAWDQDYVRKYRPSTRISSSTIKSHLSKAISKARFRYDLPIFKLGGAGKLEPHEIEHTEKWVQLIYQAR